VGLLPGVGLVTRPGFTPAWGIGVSVVWAWSGVTAYDRGTLVVTIIPTASVDANARTVKAAWAGVGSALLDGTVDQSTVTAAIDEMFPTLAISHGDPVTRTPPSSRAP